jgi:hypothetical protein
LAGDLGFDDAWIAKCFTPGTGQGLQPRIKEKRAVLDSVALELRRIIGKPVQAVHRDELRPAPCSTQFVICAFD